MQNWRTCMQVPVCSRHRLQDRAQRLAGMWDTLVMGSIFSGQPILTCREHMTGRNTHVRYKAPCEINNGLCLEMWTRQYKLYSVGLYTVVKQTLRHLLSQFPLFFLFSSHMITWLLDLNVLAKYLKNTCITWFILRRIYIYIYIHTHIYILGPASDKKCCFPCLVTESLWTDFLYQYQNKQFKDVFMG